MAVKSDGSFDALDLSVAVNPLAENIVISSKSIPNWENLSTVKQFPGKIDKKVIPIDFQHYRMTIVTKVESGVLVDTHMHEEPVFRYVIEGDLNLNGVEYGPGDWILVPGKTPYRVTTRNGYTVVASYGAKCGSPHDDVVKRGGDTDS